MLSYAVRDAAPDCLMTIPEERGFLNGLGMIRARSFRHKLVLALLQGTRCLALTVSPNREVPRDYMA